MFSRLNLSRLMSVTAVSAAGAIILLYSVLSNNQAENADYYTESAVYAFSGLLPALGINLAGKGKKTAGILTVCAAVLLPVFVNPYLTLGSANGTYLFQASIYAKRTITMLCPFLASFLIKRLHSVTENRKYGGAIMSFCYFAAAFLSAALLQSIMKRQYLFYYGYETTWNGAETIYWVITINAVYIRHIFRNTANTADKFGKENSGRCCFIYALTANAAAALALIWKSYHIKSILYDFAVKLSGNGLLYALRETTWLSYRFEIFKGIIRGEYSVGVRTFLEKFPDEFPIWILWKSEPLVSIRLTYGLPAVLALSVLFVVLIASLCFIRYNSPQYDEIGMWIRYSFAALFFFSFVSQMLLPAYELMTPLMGNGACMTAMLIVCIFLPKARPAD